MLMQRIAPLLFIATAGFTAMSGASASGQTPADVVVTNARVYTVSPTHAYAESFAVRDGKIVFVGTSSAGAEWVGPRTTVEDLHGQFVLPGLTDSHVHATAIVDLDTCDLKSEPKTLAALAEFVRGCIKRYDIPAGEWVNVNQWNFSDGNQPDAEHPTLRAALDLAAKDRPVQLIGNDGHHNAYNSFALANAATADGRRVGLSRETLRKEFAPLVKLVGVDAHGEPNGNANEEARDLMGGPNILLVNLPAVAKMPEKIVQRLNSVGITEILDPLVTPEILAVYDNLEHQGKLTVRATLAQFYDPTHFRNAAGQVDYDTMVSSAIVVREKYAKNSLIRANFVKMFADGVVEGNPYAVPPTQPEVAALHPYLQPIFAKDRDGHLAVTGYVDTGSTLCKSVRSNSAKFDDPAAVTAFIKANGHHPGQCIISSGQLQSPRLVEMEFVKRFHLAGFSVHIHAIGDAGVRTAVDAIEAARAADGISTQHDALAHLQIVNPADVQRIGRDHLYLASTFSWANYDPEYDMLVVPFFDHVAGNTYASLHPAGSYYDSALYPFKTMKDAGATLVGGSDAPVNTRSPQPFVNMAVAVTRQLPGQPPTTPAQRISIQDAIDAYTINGARYLSRDAETGSIEVGKSADFVVIDRDIVKLADSGEGLQIAKTQAIETWFKGVKVYASPALLGQ
jgi:predicted amidohydrolase YtcJ